MNPVFGTPQGIGVGPIGGIVTQTPTAKMFRSFGFCGCWSTMVTSHGFDRPWVPETGSMPRQAGGIIEKAKGRSRPAFTPPSSPIASTHMRPASTRLIRVLVIHLTCFPRIRLFGSPLVSLTPSRPGLATSFSWTDFSVAAWSGWQTDRVKPSWGSWPSILS